MAVSAVLAVTAVVGVAQARSAQKDAKRAREQMQKDADRRSAELETLLKETPAMPTPDDAAAQAARRRSTQTQRQRSGRMSTLLTDVASTGLGG